jgi:hypothetical protein
MSSIELIDRESGVTLRLAPDDDLVARYVANVSAWLDTLESACTAEQAAYARFSTAWGIDDLMLALLHERGMVA